jgi:acylphosphatase
LKITRRLKIHGRVQGVFFRESMRLRAEQLNVTGWVRNCRDGTVEAVAQGDAFEVGRLIEWAQRGPDAAKVEKVEVESAEGEGHFGTFDKKPTL